MLYYKTVESQIMSKYCYKIKKLIFKLKDVNIKLGINFIKGEVVKMIIEYDSQYDEDVKDLLVELQEYIVSIDKEKYSILTENYREEYFKKTLEEIKKYKGKMLLYKEDKKILGLVVGIINNDEISEYDFQAPKRGRITELVVTKNCRAKGYGKILLYSMEKFLIESGCKDVLLGVFGYNENAIKFYEKNGYHNRLIDMTKKLS